ncbi:hypothetical protein [Breoghania sp.]|uniref:hypothetical protein n=1 Tax=Breoghania sp. TaxID=2065378 RepID=UPI002AAAD55D|nr:hypothetical protein [Breoghania sp.]
MSAPLPRLTQIWWTVVAFAPLIVFSLSGRLGADFPDRFTLGAAAVGPSLVALVLCRQPLNPLLVAADLWLCALAVMIGSGDERLIHFADYLREASFFLALLLIGLGKHLLTPGGLYITEDDPASARRASARLLLLIALATAWSVFWRGNEALAASLPALLLFLIQPRLVPAPAG